MRSETKKNTAAEAVQSIATEEMGIETLDTRNMDSLDFHDVSVATLKAALLKAYRSGQASAS